MVRPSLLIAIFGAWALTCLIAGIWHVRRAPAVSLALFGSVSGAVVGFLAGTADGPAEVPAYTAVGASVGVVSWGSIGAVTTSARPPSRSFRRAAVLVVIAAPFAAAALTLLLRLACPLYVSGVDAGFCNYQEVDQLGGWVSGVIVAFVFDAMFVASLLLASERRARRSATFRSELQVTATQARDDHPLDPPIPLHVHILVWAVADDLCGQHTLPANEFGAAGLDGVGKGRSAGSTAGM